MTSQDLGKLMENCRNNIKAPNPSNLGKDIELIMKAMGIQACKTESKSGCVSVATNFLFSGASAKACAGSESSEGCEQIMANFNKTRIAKESLECAIKQRIQESTTTTVQSNMIKFTGNMNCCTCTKNEGGCVKYNELTGQVQPYNCSAIGNINQSNSSVVKSTTSFSINEAEEVTKQILTAVSEDINLSADSKKTGLGMDSGQKIITTSDIEKITKDENINVTNNVQKSLNQLTQENILDFNLNIESGGPCMENISQTNIIELIVNNIMGEVLSSIRTSIDETRFSTIIKAVASKEITGTDITAGSTASYFTGNTAVLIAMIIIGIIIVILFIKFLPQILSAFKSVR